jgi:hypothetical protein
VFEALLTPEVFLEEQASTPSGPEDAPLDFPWRTELQAQQQNLPQFHQSRQLLHVWQLRLRLFPSRDLMRKKLKVVCSHHSELLPPGLQSVHPPKFFYPSQMHRYFSLFHAPSFLSFSSKN